MKTKFVVGILALLFVFCSDGSVLAEDSKGPCNILQPDGDTLLNWIHDYEMAPRAYIDKSIDISSMPGAFSLLSHLQYNAAERNQGSCRNTVQWVGTGIMGIALDVQEHILDRLSVQFASACDTERRACCGGGSLGGFVDFFTSQGYTIPWSNTNASWQNVDGRCNVPCSSIGTSPNYAIDSIVEEKIETHGVGQAEAIANIKNVLHQNKAVLFTWFWPTWADWGSFLDFWNTEGEDVITNLDSECGHIAKPGQIGAHAVLCVGYDDTDPSNSYWIMVNSWGTAGGGRPNGIFRLDMDMNYDCTFWNYDEWTESYYWKTLDVSFNISNITLYVESSGTCDGKTPCYSTVQGAINAAGDFDTILVAAGTYEEDISLNASKNLTLKGGYDSTFTAQSSNTTLNSFTTSNGYTVIDRLILQ